MDPGDRQIFFLKVGLYNGCIFSVLLILIATGSQKKLVLGLIIAAIFLAIAVPLDWWILQTVRRKEMATRSWDPTSGPKSRSGHN